MSAEIDVSDISPSALLSVLYNRAKVQGLGVLSRRNQPMEPEEAGSILLEKGLPVYFDYLNGRVMKLEINGKILRTALYDRDNGYQAAEECVNYARAITQEAER